MIWVVFVLCIFLMFLATWIDEKIGEDISIPVGIIGIVGAVASVIAAFIMLINLSTTNSTIDERIAMYEEENATIEQQIATVVENYQEYESDIFKEVAPDDAVTLVSLYPELKSDHLVASQLEVYVANNEKIKELREKKIMAKPLRWWLYFGG